MFLYQRALETAIGYFELGMASDALRELDSLEPELQHARPSLELRSVVLQQLEQWEAAAKVHAELCAMPGTDIDGFIAWGCVLYELERYAECRSALLAAPPTARDHGLWNYHLACYEILLGNVEEGRRLIQRSLQLEPRLRAMALRNGNLRPLVQ